MDISRSDSSGNDVGSALHDPCDGMDGRQRSALLLMKKQGRVCTKNITSANVLQGLIDEAVEPAARNKTQHVSQKKNDAAVTIALMGWIAHKQLCRSIVILDFIVTESEMRSHD